MKNWYVAALLLTLVGNQTIFTMESDNEQQLIRTSSNQFYGVPTSDNQDNANMGTNLTNNDDQQVGGVQTTVTVP